MSKGIHDSSSDMALLLGHEMQIRIHASQDYEGELHIPEARGQMIHTVELASFNGIPEYRQSTFLSDGTQIDTTLRHGLQLIDIYPSSLTDGDDGGGGGGVTGGEWLIHPRLIGARYSSLNSKTGLEGALYPCPVEFLQEEWLKYDENGGWKPPFYISGLPNLIDGVNRGVPFEQDPPITWPWILSPEGSTGKVELPQGVGGADDGAVPAITHGRIDWYSNDVSLVVAWDGPTGRYAWMDNMANPTQYLLFPSFGAGKTVTYQAPYTNNGGGLEKKLYFRDEVYTTPVFVRGACVTQANDGSEWLLIAGWETTPVPVREVIYVKPIESTDRSGLKYNEQTFDSYVTVGDIASALIERDKWTEIKYLTPQYNNFSLGKQPGSSWLFNSSGKEAMCIRRGLVPDTGGNSAEFARWERSRSGYHYTLLYSEVLPVNGDYLTMIHHTEHLLLTLTVDIKAEESGIPGVNKIYLDQCEMEINIDAQPTVNVSYFDNESRCYATQVGSEWFWNPPGEDCSDHERINRASAKITSGSGTGMKIAADYKDDEPVFGTCSVTLNHNKSRTGSMVYTNIKVSSDPNNWSYEEQEIISKSYIYSCNRTYAFGDVTIEDNGYYSYISESDEYLYQDTFPVASSYRTLDTSYNVVWSYDNVRIFDVDMRHGVVAWCKAERNRNYGGTHEELWEFDPEEFELVRVLNEYTSYANDSYEYDDWLHYENFDSAQETKKLFSQLFTSVGDLLFYNPIYPPVVLDDYDAVVRILNNDTTTGLGDCEWYRESPNVCTNYSYSAEVALPAPLPDIGYQIGSWKASPRVYDNGTSEVKQYVFSQLLGAYCIPPANLKTANPDWDDWRDDGSEWVYNNSNFVQDMQDLTSVESLPARPQFISWPIMLRGEKPLV